MCSLFLHKKISYNIRKVQVLLSPPARSTYYGTNSMNLQTSLVWNNWPSYIMLHEIFCSFLFYYIKRLVLNEVINKNKISLSMSCNKNLVSLLSSFAAIGKKGDFRKSLAEIFKFAGFSRCHTNTDLRKISNIS